VTLVTISIAAGTMLIMALILSYVLGWANKRFKVEVDPKIESVLEALPGVNCGGCGYLGCSDYAVAVVTDNDPVNKCTVGGDACADSVAKIMGVDAGQIILIRAIVHCGAHGGDRLKLTPYRGEKRCSAAHQVAGVQGCTFGCLGLGDCVRSCNYDAIHLVGGLAVVNYENCIGCGACSKVCPRKIIAMTAFMEDKIPSVSCSNKDKAKDAKAVCTTSCIACKACSKITDIFKVVDNLSITAYDTYIAENHEDALKAIEKCPTNCIHLIGKKSLKNH
jgi:electron transport complex protein RnfB